MFDEGEAASIFDIAYFSGEWQHTFSDNDVEPKEFTDSGGAVHQANMMSGEEDGCIRTTRTAGSGGSSSLINQKRTIACSRCIS